MAEFKKEIERLTERIAAERWRISQAQRLAPKLQRGETVSTQNISVAQRRASSAMRVGSRASVMPKYR
jgi:ribosomal protein L27